ncbi:AAA family ATPase [Psychromonas sp. KJ10-10]|uniref:AAA family ATPase n=1 Tax=Psychromonas sp. KJ10-10 TaxID=3391823 RepID=UPI0039B6E23B
MVERTLISFPSQLQLIERLQHLLYLSSSITFISGEAGSGKSTLVEQLSNLLPDDTQQAFIRLYQTTPATQIRQQIIAQLFEDPLFNAEDSLANILLLLKDSQKSDVSRAVVIDNAELLPAQLLTELAEVIDQKFRFTDHEISFILLSDDLKTSQMVKTIKKLPRHLNVATLTFKLAPLSANEAEQLLNHRFQQIGYSPQIEHQDAIALQLSRCQGIPEKILALATKVSSGELDDRKLSWMKNGLPAILVMFAFIIVVASLAYYLYPKFIKTDPEVDIIIETDSVLPESIDSTELITDSDIDISLDTISDSESTEVLAGQWNATTQSVTDNQLSVGEADSQQRVVISEQSS